MRGAVLGPGARPSARLLACSAAALAVVLAVQVAYAPPAQARYPYGTPRDTRVTMRADEVLTVDVLGVDDPAVGATWVRSSVCLGGSGDSCIRQLFSADST